jgi:hypothetical protein
MSKINNLFKSKLNVLNIGIETFKETIKMQQVNVTHLEWKPMAGGDQEMINLITKLKNNPNRNKANQEALDKLKKSQPVWVDVKTAKESIKLDKFTFLHAGPPITWERMSIPMRGAILAVIKYEGMATNDKEAELLASSGKIKYVPCHEYGCVGPMTGIISASMPLIVVKNTEYGNYSYSTFNEGAGDVARFGAHGENTVKRLKWIENTLAPAMNKVVKTLGGLNLKVLISQALNMGDELHMRNNTSTAIFIRAIAPSLMDATNNREDLITITKFLTTNNDQFFLNFAMAAMKASADAAHNVKDSTMVTAMARNGVEIGIKVSGLGNRWFIAPAAEVKGLYFPGFSVADANKDIGDSAIMETGGVGGFAMAAGPAIVKVLGAGTFYDAINYTKEMYEITIGESEVYVIPNLEFKGTPTGIDIVKVVETGIQPVINTAIASAKAGGGMIGAGVSRAPMKMFVDALKAFNNK